MPINPRRFPSSDGGEHTASGDDAVAARPHSASKDLRSLRSAPTISHEGLSQMVGTTRLRIRACMQRFRAPGLIEGTTEPSLSVQEQPLTASLA